MPQIPRRRADVDLEAGPTYRLPSVPVEVLVCQGNRRGPVGDLGRLDLLALLDPGSPLMLAGQQTSVRGRVLAVDPAVGLDPPKKMFIVTDF